MNDTVTVDIPYESLDPLTIGSCDDPSAVYREKLFLEVFHARNLWAWLKPNEPPALPDVTAAAAAALERPDRRPALLRSDRPGPIARDHHRQPVPADPGLEAPARRARCGGAPRGARRARRLRQRQGVPDVGARHRDEARAREPRPDAALCSIPFFQNDDPRNAALYTFRGVSSRGTPVWVHNEVATSDVTIAIGQAQSNHWGYGGGGKLILPGVCSDETIESNHGAFVLSPHTHYGAMTGTDAGRHRRGRDDVRPHVHAQLGARHEGGRCAISTSAPIPRRTARRCGCSTTIYAYRRPLGGPADIAVCGVFAPTDHLFFHTGWGCMSADLVLKDGGDMIYCSPSPGVETKLGTFPGLALFDLHEALHAAFAAKPGAAAPRHPPSPGRDVGGLHLGADLRGHVPQTPHHRDPGGEPGDGARHRDERDHLAGNRVRARRWRATGRTRRW